MLYVANGTATVSSPLPGDDRYQTDPSFAEMQQAIAEFRRAEDDEQGRQELSAP